MACSVTASSFLLILIIAISFHMQFCSAARNLAQTTSTEFIRTSCSTTSYPRLCYTSLSIHAVKIQTSPMLLANTALNVTLSSAKSTSTMMQKLSKTQGINPREASAMQDCMEELTDSVDEIRRSMEELSNAKGYKFQEMMNDVQTWVSAALTDETTCSDGFAGKKMNGNLKTVVRGQIVNIAHLTSNALSLVNNYASLHG